MTTSNIFFYECRAAEEDLLAARSSDSRQAAAHAGYAAAYRDHVAMLCSRVFTLPKSACTNKASGERPVAMAGH